jgi:hypothetical protein
MLELAGSELGQVGTGDQRQDNIGRKPFFELFLDSKCVGCVDQNASMLLRNDALNDIGEVVHVWESLDTKNDIVEGYVLMGRVIRILHH